MASARIGPKLRVHARSSKIELPRYLYCRTCPYTNVCVCACARSLSLKCLGGALRPRKWSRTAAEEKSKCSARVAEGEGVDLSFLLFGVEGAMGGLGRCCLLAPSFCFRERERYSARRSEYCCWSYILCYNRVGIGIILAWKLWVSGAVCADTRTKSFTLVKKSNHFGIFIFIYSALLIYILSTVLWYNILKGFINVNFTRG